MGSRYDIKIRVTHNDIKLFRDGVINCPASYAIKREVPRLTGCKVTAVWRNGAVEVRCLDSEITFRINPFGRRLQLACQEYESIRKLIRASEWPQWSKRIRPMMFYIEM